MVYEQGLPTKILIIDENEILFEIKQCVARALEGLPPIELLHARDAADALLLIDSIAPDVIIISDENTEDNNLLIDSLSHSHPPIVLQTSEDFDTLEPITSNREIAYIEKSESIEGIQKILTLAAALGSRFTETSYSSSLH